MKLSHKFSAAAAAAGIAAAAAIVPASAATPLDNLLTTVDAVASEATPAAEGTTELTEKEKAELTGMRLDNAKKGVETAKDIVDTLGTIGGWFFPAASGE